MNNLPFRGGQIKLAHIFFLLIVSLITTQIITANSFAQTSIWRYAVTLPDGAKGYINDEVKILLPGKNKIKWEKIVDPDSSSTIALIEWDCAGKLYLTHQVTYYKSDQSAIGTKKYGFQWSPIIPGSAADFFYRRVCLVTTLQWAEITRSSADLRALPNAAAPIIRTGKRGERFAIVPETGLGGWFNIVDTATQQDYWLTSDLFKRIDPTAAKTKAPDNRQELPKPTNRKGRRKPSKRFESIQSFQAKIIE
jgi:hypothetical protein